MSTSAHDEQPVDDTTTEAAPEAIDAEAMLRDLAGSVVLLPQERLAEEEQPPEGSIAIPVIEQDGTQYVPVFTSEETLRSAGADPAPAVRVPLADLAASWPADDLWLAVDPGSENGVTMPPEVVGALASFAQVPGDVTPD